MKYQGRMPGLCAGQLWALWSTPSTREKQKEKGEKGEITGSEELSTRDLKVSMN